MDIENENIDIKKPHDSITKDKMSIENEDDIKNEENIIENKDKMDIDEKNKK